MQYLMYINPDSASDEEAVEQCHRDIISSHCQSFYVIGIVR